MSFKYFFQKENLFLLIWIVIFLYNAKGIKIE
jgi:hypothetical protein